MGKLLVDHVLKSHVGGHDHQGVVSLGGDTSFYREVYVGALEEFKDGVVGVGRELCLVPEYEFVDSGLVLGEPSGHAHVVDRTEVLNGGLMRIVVGIGEEAGLADGGRTSQQEVEGLHLTLAAQGHDLVEVGHDLAVARPGVVTTQFGGTQGRLDELSGDEPEARLALELQVGCGYL